MEQTLRYIAVSTKCINIAKTLNYIFNKLPTESAEIKHL